jgi:hypothetical protein
VRVATQRESDSGANGARKLLLCLKAPPQT